MAIAIDWTQHHGNAFDGKRVVVTGGAGFIGSHVVQALVSLGAPVIVFDDLSTGNRGNLPQTQASIEFIQADVADDAAVRQAMENASLVFHCAACVSVAESWEEAATYERVNVLGTLNVVKAAVDAGVDRIVYSGSASAYGNVEVDAASESLAPLTTNIYAATKLAGEQLVAAATHHGETDAIVLRYFNVFGPRQRADSPYSGVIAAFASRLLNREPITIHGDGEQTRDFVHVANVVHANLLAARAPGRFAGEPFNVGTGSSISILQLFELLRAAANVDTEPTFGPGRVGDIRHSRAEIARAQDCLGYNPIIDLQAGLADTMAWYAGGSIPQSSPSIFLTS